MRKDGWAEKGWPASSLFPLLPDKRSVIWGQPYNSWKNENIYEKEKKKTEKLKLYPDKRSVIPPTPYLETYMKNTNENGKKKKKIFYPDKRSVI